NVQRIMPDGSKRFLPGARIDGCMWRAGFAPGSKADIIAIGEGAATMAAVHLATGVAVVAAMTAGNLGAVAMAVAGFQPGARLILCADMDTGPAGNLGLRKADDAALAVGGLVSHPPRPPDWPESKGYDFADTWTSPGGGELIRRALGMTEHFSHDA
ncbi:toprim domain-containing protein, partial [Sandarakinorhabdus sp.]|uniref:toprim domain-containing protein n=1 Tax=Sandarakinorhabdus sp. TaxID=1916663 RepID=UPI00286DF035